MFHKVLSNSRFTVLIAVMCSFLASVTVMLYGAVQTILTMSQVLVTGHSGDDIKDVIVSFIEIIDLLLLATVFYITALGLYELFIDDRLKVPSWLEIHNIDQLKAKLASVVVVILSVIFLGQAVKWEGQTDILPFGISIASVIAALTYFLSQTNKKSKESGHIERFEHLASLQRVGRNGEEYPNQDDYPLR